MPFSSVATGMLYARSCATTAFAIFLSTGFTAVTSNEWPHSGGSSSRTPTSQFTRFRLAPHAPEGAKEDRLHPVKRLRPIPRGELPRETALALAAFLAALALVIAAVLGLASLGLLALFLALQAAYSLGLKHVVLLDVMMIGALS